MYRSRGERGYGGPERDQGYNRDRGYDRGYDDKGYDRSRGRNDQDQPQYGGYKPWEGRKWVDWSVYRQLLEDQDRLKQMDSKAKEIEKSNRKTQEHKEMMEQVAKMINLGLKPPTKRSRSTKEEGSDTEEMSEEETQVKKGKGKRKLAATSDKTEMALKKLTEELRQTKQNMARMEAQHNEAKRTESNIGALLQQQQQVLTSITQQLSSNRRSTPITPFYSQRSSNFPQEAYHEEILFPEEEEPVESLPQRLMPNSRKRVSKKTHRMGSTSEEERTEDPVDEELTANAELVRNWGESEGELTEEVDKETAVENKIKRITAGLKGKSDWKKIMKKLLNDAGLEYINESKANMIGRLARKYILD